MNRSKMINFTIIVALALFSMHHFLQIAQAAGHNGVTQRLSSIEEFKECVNFQNSVPVKQVRVIWDVQTAGCFVVLADGRFLTVPDFIKELEDYAIAQRFKKGGM